MATAILAVGATALDSPDVPVVAGTPLTVALKNTAAAVPADATVDILLKDDAGFYNAVYRLTCEHGRSSVMISAPGTYLFRRLAGATCGVFSG